MKIFREILGVQPQDREESQGVQENQETLGSSIYFSSLHVIQAHDVST